MTSGSLWNYYRDKVKGSTPNNDDIIDTAVVVPLKDLSNFWRYLDFLLINY